VRLLLLLVLELAVVHQAADRRHGSWGDLDEIDILFVRQPEGFGEWDDAERLSFDADQAYLRDRDLAVDAVRVFLCDGC
jgi:hypothetical protein